MLNNLQSTLSASPEETPSVHLSQQSQVSQTRTSIARLSAIQISRMSRQSLIEMIELTQQYMPQEIVSDRLQVCDRLTLERFTFLARRICRNLGY